MIKRKGMSEVEELKRRVENNEKAINRFVDQQHANLLVLRDIQSSVDDVKLWIRGDKDAGVKGLVNDMKDFKRDFAVDVIKDINNLTERLKWTEGRLQTLEMNDTKSAKRNGFVAGFSAIVASIVTYLISVLK